MCEAGTPFRVNPADAIEPERAVFTGLVLPGECDLVAGGGFGPVGCIGRKGGER